MKIAFDQPLNTACGTVWLAMSLTVALMTRLCFFCNSRSFELLQSIIFSMITINIYKKEIKREKKDRIEKKLTRALYPKLPQ